MPVSITVELKSQIPWLYFQDPKSRLWIGTSPVLKLTVEAETLPALYESMTEAAIMFFQELLSTGDLPKFFTENSLLAVQPLPPRHSRDVSFDVPLNTQRISPRDIEKAFSK